MNEFIKQCKKYFGFAMLFSMVINILQLTFPIYMLQVYDRVLTSYNLSTLVVITLAAIIALITLALMEWIRSRLLIRAGIEFDRNLSLSVLNVELKRAASFHRAGSQGEMKDVQTLRNFFSGSAVFAFFDIPWMPIYFLLIFILHPSLGITSVLGGVIVFFLGLLTQKLTSQKISQANNIYRRANLLLSCALRNAYAVKSMGMVDTVGKRWKIMNDEVIWLQTHASKRAGLLHSVSKAFRIGLQVLIYAVGAYLTVTHQATAGVMIAASIIMGRALAPIDQAMSTYRQSIEARSSYRKIRNSLTATKTDSFMDLPLPVGDLSAKGVTFSVAGRSILKGINFHLRPGTILAIIGPSASGKSTLCKVLLGIWPLSGGEIRLDGAELALWDSEKLGAFLGYLPQDIELFPGTIAENIARLKEVDAEEVVRAAQLAGVHELILHLPKGYDTQVGEFGEELSGGQRQRIGFARAVYGEPCLIVLDEPNSNLDEEGEARLLQSLARLKQLGKTVVLVAHKPSILSAADEIMFLKEGQVMIYGPREAVLNKISDIRRQQNGQFIKKSADLRPNKMGITAKQEAGGYVSP